MQSWLRAIVQRMSGLIHDQGENWRGWVPPSVSSVPTGIEWLSEIAGGGDAALAQHVASLMRGVPITKWTELDRALRSPWLTSKGVRRLIAHEPPVAVELLGVATMSADGYTRQAALELLAGLGHPRGIPYVLLRLADWVGPVRESARQTLRSLIANAPVEVIESLLDHHRLIERLPRVERADLTGVHVEIMEFLRSKASRASVRSGMSRVGPPRRRRFCFTVLGDLVIRDDRLLSAAIADHDPAVRAWLARMLAEKADSASHEDIEQLLRDPSSSVATIMIRSLPRATLNEHVEALQECAIADARAIREAARFALRDLGGFDAAAAARALLDRTPPGLVRPGWVATLGELGSEQDAALVRPFLLAGRARLRESALFALGRVAPGEAVPQSAAMLRDASGRVRRLAVAILSRSPHESWRELATEVFQNEHGPARTAALSVLSTLPGWEPVPTLLDGLQDDHELVRSRAWQNIDAWQRRYGTRGWVTPSATCREAVRLRTASLGTVDNVPDFAAGSWAAFRKRLESDIE